MVKENEKYKSESICKSGSICWSCTVFNATSITMKTYRDKIITKNAKLSSSVVILSEQYNFSGGGVFHSTSTIGVQSPTTSLNALPEGNSMVHMYARYK